MSSRNGATLVNQGAAWISQHRDEWMELQRVCLEIEAKRDRHGRPKAHSITRGGIYATCEALRIPISGNLTFRRDHDLWSVLSRYLVDMHPQLKRVIHPRECEVARQVRMHGLPALGKKYKYNVRSMGDD